MNENNDNNLNDITEDKIEKTNDILINTNTKENVPFSLFKKYDNEKEYINNNNNNNLSKKLNEDNLNWKRNFILKEIVNKKILYYYYIENNKNNLLYYAEKTSMFNITIFAGNDKLNVNKQIMAYITFNVLSNNFIVYNNQDLVIEKIRYEINPFGFNGPTKIYVDIINDISNINHFKNKTPIYNDIFKSYVLKFIDRKIKSSVKNFQLVNINDNNMDLNEKDIFFQFGLSGEKNSKDVYFIDYKSPFSHLTSFALGIISLTSKMLCEELDK